MTLASAGVRRSAAACALLLGALCALASAQGVPAAASLRGAGAAEAKDLAAQAGAPLSGAGVLEGHTPHRMLHFTFDDGPDREQTPRLLDALDRMGHKATFFFSTSRFKGTERRNAFAPDLAREVARRGHQIGSHGFDHRRMAQMKPAEALWQIEQSETMFARVFGVRTYLMRPPFGSRNATVDTRLSQGSYATVMWNIGMADWNRRAPEEIARTFFRVLERNQQESGDRGGIVLLHDTHEWSVEAYGLIARELAARNCELLTRGEELYDVAESLLPFARPPGDAELAARQAIVRQRVAAACGTGRARR